MKSLFLQAAAAALACSSPAVAQIATSNEDGATGAHSPNVESSFTSEGRFGPRTALDDLRADVDREKEQEERLRKKLLQEAAPARTESEPGPPPPPATDESEQPLQ